MRSSVWAARAARRPLSSHSTTWTPRNGTSRLMRDSSWRRGTEVDPGIWAWVYSPCSRTSISASAESVSSRWARVAGAISRAMALSPASAVVVLAEHVGRDLPGGEVVTAALEADQVAPVHVDLDGGPVAEVVELMDLVLVGNQERHRARLHEDGAVLLERGVPVAGAIVHAAG